MVKGRNEQSFKAEAKFMAIVESKGGQLLTPYVSASEIVKIRCANGHDFERAPTRVNEHDWCTSCPSKRELKYRTKFDDGLLRKNGTLIDEYVKFTKRVTVKCSYDHQFKTCPSTVANTTFFCDTCDKNNNISYNDRILETVKSRGGIIIESFRSGSGTKLKIKCIDDHVFTRIIGDIKKGDEEMYE